MRKKLSALNLIALSWLFLLCACSEESKVREAAIGGAREQFQTEMKAEIAKGVKGKIQTQATAARVLTDRSEFKAQKVEINGERAQVLVEVSAIPVQARTALIEIIEKFDEKKEARFNAADALKLILQQMDLMETRSSYAYPMKLEKTDGWQVVKEKNK
ncbi:MAG TPA: hypothetical protein VIG33_14005 [Pseudobdellovibrionaceae bacterium]|jgi:hypothetical protein